MQTAEIGAKVFFYTQAARLAEEKVETPTLALAKVNARNFLLALSNILANVEAETLVDLLASIVA